MENLCQFGKFSCFGCCGFDFGSKGEIKKTLLKNTELLKKLGIGNFCSRETRYVEGSGVCAHLIFENGKVFCPCHPLQNDGEDLREKRCDKYHECETVIEFKKMSEEDQKKFLEFVRKKNLDWYDYSLAMRKDVLLKEFIKKYKNPSGLSRAWKKTLEK
jgi:hypothetical protein